MVSVLSNPFFELNVDSFIEFDDSFIEFDDDFDDDSFIEFDDDLGLIYPPQSLQVAFTFPCSQIPDPPQSLQYAFCFPCSHFLSTF